MNMIYLAIVLFVLAAVLGIVILVSWLTHKEASKGVIYSHGIGAAAALIILVVYAFQNSDNFPKVSIGLFVISALIGFYMFIRDMKKKMSPLALAFTHAFVSVCGLVALLVFAFA